MSDRASAGLPASIQAAWGLRDRPTKGPKPGLSLERIVDAAVAVAASEGLAAVSMSRVASELDSSAMALYRYVAAKDELFALMVDSVLGPVGMRPDPDEIWRDGLTRWAWHYHDVLREHPWVLRVPLSAPPVTPNQTAWLEEGLGTLRDSGLPEPDKLSVMLLVSGYVRNEATLMADLGPPPSASLDTEIMVPWGRLLATLTDAVGFPFLHAALASGAFDQDDDPDDEFVFGLDRILDGVEAHIEKTRKRGLSRGSG